MYKEDGVKKEEVERELGFSISNSQFQQALEHARRKRERICQRAESRETLSHWYLVKLTEECARGIVLSKYTVDAFRAGRGR